MKANTLVTVDTWSKFMITIAIINILIVCYVFTNVNSSFEMKLFILAAIFVVVNSIRSIWLRQDNARLCLFDTIMSSPLIGRTITTVSELAFVALLILVVKEIIRKSNYSNKSSLNLTLNIVFFMILIAEVFCWSGCLSHNQYWNMLEESTWTLSSIIISIIMVILYVNTSNKSFEKFLYVAILVSVMYQVFMIKVDVPMYYQRGKNHIPNKEYENKSLLDKIKDMYKCKKISNSNEDWDNEMPWMTGYFTSGSWISIALVVWYQINRKLF